MNILVDKVTHTFCIWAGLGGGLPRWGGWLGYAIVMVPLVKEEEEVGEQLVVVWLVMESTVNV